MESVALPTVISFVSALLTLGGVTGVTSQDINGFFNTLFGFMTLVSIVWSYFAHRNKVQKVAIGEAAP